MKNKRLVKYFYILIIGFCILLYQMPKAYSITTKSGNNLIDFGSFAQLESTASITVSNKGTTTSSGISDYQGSTEPAVVTYIQTNLGNSDYEDVKFTSPSNSVITTDDCTITVGNFSPSETHVQLYREGNIIYAATEATISYGATVTINGFCKTGTYEGVFVIPHTSQKCNLWSGSCSDNSGEPVSVKWILRVWNKIALIEKQKLDFGTIWSPSENASVTISTSGARSKSGNIELDAQNTGSAGAFEILAVAGSPIVLTFPTSTPINGAYQSMQITNFVSSIGTQFTMQGDSQSFNVGATLNIPKGTIAGTYNGDYEIIISY